MQRSSRCEPRNACSNDDNIGIFPSHCFSYKRLENEVLIEVILSFYHHVLSNQVLFTFSDSWQTGITYKIISAWEVIKIRG